MPTVWSERGFIFMIHTNDHEPAHIHAYKAGGVALINLVDLTVLKVVRMKLPEVRIAKRIVAENRALLLEKWEGIHGT